MNNNPYKNYDKGMDDAYSGLEPQANNSQYEQGYNRMIQIEYEEHAKEQEAQYWKDYESYLKENNHP